jgi:hypothetical protein
MTRDKIRAWEWGGGGVVVITGQRFAEVKGVEGLGFSNSLGVVNGFSRCHILLGLWLSTVENAIKRSVYCILSSLEMIVMATYRQQ